MEKVKVFHVGLDSFGRHGFEKFIEMDKFYERVDVELVGVCDSDPERLENAEKLADSQDLDIETWESIEEAYQKARKENDDNSKILIYDAGPPEMHAEHIYRSLRNGFYHLAEKPPSMTREEHIKEKKLMLDGDVRFTVDFIERESPVISKTLQILKDREIESMEIFRESSIGVEKLTNKVERSGVKGGAVLDKMCHEAYLMDLAEPEEVENVEKEYLMPYSENGEALMSVRGGKTREIGELTAAGMCTANIYGSCDITLHGSWLGLSERARTLGKELEKMTGHNPVKSDFSLTPNRGLLDEEARFFVIKGERDLFGDMLHERIFDLETGEEIETPDLLHDQLYRVLESSVKHAVGLEGNLLTEDEIDRFMNIIFDISESQPEKADVYEEVEKANSRVSELIADNVFEAEASKSEL
jgi:predicted dehydrogenase